MGFWGNLLLLIVIVACSCFPVALSEASRGGDVAVMQLVKQGMTNLGDLNWSDPNPCNWAQVGCDDRGVVKMIHIAGRSLEGTLPPELKNLTGLLQLDVSSNKLTGPVPSLAGLGLLEVLLLNHNNFSSLPSDTLFSGMSSLISVDVGDNPFSEWEIPAILKDAGASLRAFYAESANIVGPIPDFFGRETFPSLYYLHLGGNRLEGGLPASFAGSNIRSLRLNNVQPNSNLYGAITLLQGMTQLTEVWLHGNHFSGPLPDFTRLTSLNTLILRDNELTGVVPTSLVGLDSLRVVSLSNNYLQGPTPKFDINYVEVDVAYGTNRFCSDVPGVSCDPRADILLSIAESVGYPRILAEGWRGYDPCGDHWLGIVCSDSHEITTVAFPPLGFKGTISPNFAKLVSLRKIVLRDNSLSGTIPTELRALKDLVLLDVSNNDLYGDVPRFTNPNLVVKTQGNPHFGEHY